MGDTQWENCGAETLLEEFFAQDDLRQLAESAGKILDCPLLVLATWSFVGSISTEPH